MNKGAIEDLRKVDAHLGELCSDMMFSAIKAGKGSSPWAVDLAKDRVLLSRVIDYLIDEEMSNPEWDNVTELPPKEG